MDLEAFGGATVTRIGPCPPFRPGTGAVVTGKFAHEADENSQVVRLRLEGQAEETGVTANHPCWSIDRGEFVPVGDLAQGELVSTDDGPRRVVAITPDPNYRGYLYNIETTEHVYLAGPLGTLVHNSCFDAIGRGMHITNKVGAGAARAPRHHIFPREHVKWFKDRGVAIDRYTLPLDQGTHTALHTWSGSRGGWNTEIMGRLMGREVALGRQLTKREILKMGAFPFCARSFAGFCGSFSCWDRRFSFLAHGLRLPMPVGLTVAAV